MMKPATSLCSKNCAVEAAMDELPPTDREIGTENDHEPEHLREIIASYAARATSGPPQRFAQGSFAGDEQYVASRSGRPARPPHPGGRYHIEERLEHRADVFRQENSMRTFRAMLGSSEAQGLVEYALIIALVSIVAIAALRFLGSKSSNTLRNAGSNLAY